jgi:predicted SnoaL-like aldol condensation-catalyzing enzyme
MIAKLSFVLLAGCATAAVPPVHEASACAASVDSHRKIVLAFYTEALVELQPGPAFTKYMSSEFIDHKPGLPAGTREAAATFLEGLIKEMPQPHWDIIRTIAEGDMVFLHARFTPAPGAPAYAIADVFRLKDCKIVEHWDVVAPPPEHPVNPNSQF